ncbi:BnaA06g00920D [Brassica napus]|uniref:Mechanosensitive ion channel protein n=1 Tax=Brassica napus TaxID=3708 RepID=A0A078GFJ4_BRANA|nr:BnaA06g00920D [Brassica napus]
MAVDPTNDRRDVIVKIDDEEKDQLINKGEGGKFSRESSYNFLHGGDEKEKTGYTSGGEDLDDDGEGFDFTPRRNEPVDPPSKLIYQFLNKQKASGDEISLDMEPNMPELRTHTIYPSQVTATMGNRNEAIDAVRRRHNRVTLSPSESEEEDRVDETEVVKCSSNRTTKTLMKTKTRSRLMDPITPGHPDMHSGRTPKSGHLKSGNLKPGFSGKTAKPGNSNPDLEEEEDPFSEEDFPEGYQKDKLSLWVIMEWIFLILIIAGLICSLVIPFLRGKELWNLALWKWEVMVLVLICGRLVSSWIVRLLVYFVESNFLLRKKVLYFVYGIRKAVQNCLWLGLVLIAWHFLFDKKVQRETGSHRMNTKNVSAWKMKRLMNVIRKGALSTLDEQIQDTSTHKDDKATQIQSENEAKQAARKIFQNVAMPGSRYIYIEDFMRFLTEDESERAMNLFEEASESHRISKSCLKNWVVDAFRERRALALTLNDTKTAVNRLHRIINILVGIVIIIIWLLILGIATTKFLLVISSQLLLVVFVFGNSCKNLFEAVIFVFVNHPFDVGDRCEIDGVQMVVEEMNILTTVFLRFDNQKIVYPNSLLGNKPIANYYRSPDMQEIVDFFVHIATPTEKITALKQRILSYVDNKKDLWYPSPRIAFREMCGLNSMKITIWATHKMNHHNMGERFVRRGQLLEEIGKSCRETDIEYRLYPLNINVKSLPPAAAPIISDRMPMSWNNQQRNA